MNHVSVSPTDGNGPTQGQRKTLTRVGIEATTFGLDHRCSTDRAARSDGQNFSLSLCGPVSISGANAHYFRARNAFSSLSTN